MEQGGETRAKSDPRAKSVDRTKRLESLGGQVEVGERARSCQAPLGGTVCTQARLSWRRRASAWQGETTRVGLGSVYDARTMGCEPVVSL